MRRREYLTNLDSRSLVRAATVAGALGSAVAAGWATSRVSPVQLLLVGVVVMAAAMVVWYGPRAILWPLLIAMPLPMLSQGISFPLGPLAGYGLALVVVAASAKRMDSRGRVAGRRRITSTDAAIALVLLASALSLAASPSRELGIGLQRLVVLGGGIAWYYSIVVLIDSDERISRALILFAVSGLFVAVFSLLQVVLPAFTLPGFINSQASVVRADVVAINLRASGPIGDYELSAEYLTLAGLVQFYLLMNGRGLARVIFIPMLLVTLIAILSTGTRSALILGAVGGIVLLGATIRRLRITGAIGVLAAFLVVAAVVPPVVQTLQSQDSAAFAIDRLLIGLNGGIASGMIPRFDLWASDLATIRDPVQLLIGDGLGYDFFGRLVSYPHSLPVSLLLSVGLAGLIAWILVAVSLGRRLWGRIRRADRKAALLALVLLGVLVVDQLKVELIRQPHYEFAVLGLLGLLSSIATVSSPREADSGDPQTTEPWRSRMTTTRNLQRNRGFVPGSKALGGLGLPRMHPAATVTRRAAGGSALRTPGIERIAAQGAP